MNIFVGNLSRDVTEEDLRAEFAVFGAVSSVAIIKDKYSGQPRGFAFVEMPDNTEGQSAIAGLKGKSFKDRTMDVSEAQPRTGFKGGGGGRAYRGGAGRSDGRFIGKRGKHRR